MIRPYLAIIKDSFRAAIASRVLVIMLILIALFLAALAPFYAKEEIAYKLFWMNHIENPDGAIDLIVENRENDDREQLKHIWSLIPKSAQDRTLKFHAYNKKQEDESVDAPMEPEFEGFERLNFYKEFADGLNTAIESDEFYDENIFKTDLIIDAEARSLVDFGVDKLSEEQKRRLNRLLLTNAFNGRIKPPEESSVDFGYLTWHWMTIVGGKVVMHEQIASWLPWILDKFVLSIGLLISILVTASIMPSMFEPGSLTLLMSKPIHRWALYIAKFFGACAFAGLLSAFLFFGLWLVLGFRVGYWDQSLIYSIPIYIFVFAIYYSVSAFLGMFFKNTIVSIIGTLLFWIFCFGIGSTYETLNRYTYGSSAATVAESNDSIVKVGRYGVPSYWNESDQSWNPTLVSTDVVRQSEGMRQTFSNPLLPRIWLPELQAPVYNEEYDVWLSAASGLGDPQGMQTMSSLLRCARPNTGGEPHVVRGLPNNPVCFFSNSKGQTICVNGGGNFYLLNSDPMEAKAVENAGFGRRGGPVQVKTKSGDAKADGESKKGDASQDEPEKKPEPKVELFKEIGPVRTLNVRDHRFAAINSINDEIVIYQSRTLFVYKPDEKGVYAQDRKVHLDVEFDSTMSAWVQYQGNTIFIAFGNGQIMTLTADTLLKQKMFQPESRSAIHAISASPNGRFLAVCYRNGYCWILDNENNDKMRKASVRGQRFVTAARFNSNNELMVSVEGGPVTWYDPESWKSPKNVSPEWTRFQLIYYRGVRWIYLVCPKPGEFYKLVEHLSGSKQATSNPNLDLTVTTEPERPWAPFVNGFWFVLFMLGFSCLVFSRTDY